MAKVSKRKIRPDETALLDQLEELSRSLGIQIRHESLKKAGFSKAGGLCRLKGEYLLIINANASVGEKIQTIAEAVKRFDLSQVYLRPGLREFLGNSQTPGTPT